MYLNKSCRSAYIDHTLRGVFALVPILPPPEPPSPSPKRFHGRAAARSFRDDTEVDELRLSDVGEESVDDSADEAAFLAVRAAAAGLQCAQTKMPKPRPLQLAHMAPLPGVRIGAMYSSERRAERTLVRYLRNPDRSRRSGLLCKMYAPGPGSATT
ncbi:hypothetical protein Aspvir_001530 [Aspergillus viridinutans]|uniref:Uncharacterized protein n=1 Tax=Aspergillus viridinutans TaxID=75553 RepID=A0A9P3EZL3_ASPVI|nr:uncharacterized protein Aspvir_001530 [Aspergillus viridinutans]GIJ99398.1 hypothetical protein Aspvir_001530 [Aspergillus viridinutans]